MTRAKSGMTSRRHAKKVMKRAKGFRGTRSAHFKNAREAVHHSLAYAYRDRRNRKRDFRRLWIARINAAVRPFGLSYSAFMSALSKAGIVLDRKALSELAIHDPAAFGSLVELAKKQAG